MWSDNEAEVDLLGFDYLVDSLIAVLNESHLLPLTVGVNGDWGSGKSSLMRMTANRLRDETDDFAVIEFSPWLHEDRQDIKSALVATILDELDELVPEEKRGHLRELWALLTKLVSRSRAAAAPLAAAGAAAAGAPPEIAMAAGGVAGSVAAEIGDTPESPSAAAANDLLAPREFRLLFSELIATLGQRTVVVLVDDLDRCLPDTVVDTLEAIRLFLSVPSTAYVIAAHREMVEAAVDRRYPTPGEDEGSVGRDYLEKMLQVTIHIPPLSEPEAETFLTLLLCELHLSSEDVQRVLAAASSQRDKERLTVAMNEGRVADVLDDLAEPLGKDLRWVTAIAPAIAGGLRGNPRQLKRFLNTLRLRARTSQIRGVSLDHAILAKLMVLEEVDGPGFETLFRWQLEHGGKAPQLAAAEAGLSAADAEESADDRDATTEQERNEEVSAWQERTAVARWLTLEPPLADRDLGPYFYLVRDRFAPGGLTARLPASLQQLIAQLSLTSPTMRRDAVARALILPPEDLDQLSSALADRARRAPRDPSTASLLEMAAANASLRPVLADTLDAMSLAAVPPTLPPILLTQFPSGPPPDIDAVLDTWESQTVSASLAASVRSARQVGVS